MSERSLEIKILMDIKKALSALDQLEGKTGEFSASATEDFVKVRNSMMQGGYEEAKAALEDYSTSALQNFRQVQAQLDRFDTDEAAEEYLQLMKTSDEFSDQAVSDFLQIQKATENLSDEAVEDFMKMRQAMDEVQEGTQQLGGGVAGMTSQFTYMLSDAPMLLMDVRMGMMGIMNNLQPMMTMWAKNAAQMGGNMAVMKSLAGTMVGPAGIAAAISAVVFVGPQLIDFFKGSKKAAEAAKEAQKEHRQELERLEETIQVKQLEDELEKTKKLIKIKEDDLEQNRKKKQAIEEEKQANEKLISAVYSYVNAKNVKERADEDEINAMVSSMVSTERYKEKINSLGYTVEEAKDKVAEIEKKYKTLTKATKDSEMSLEDKIEDDRIDIKNMKNKIPKIEREISQRKRLKVGIENTKEEIKKLNKEVKEEIKLLTIINRLSLEPRGLGEFDDKLTSIEQKWYNIYTNAKAVADEWTSEKMEGVENVSDSTDQATDRIQTLYNELPQVTGAFRLLGDTASQALMQTDNAGQALMRTMKSLLAQVASLSVMYGGLKIFAGGAMEGISLLDFLGKGLFGGAFASGGRPPTGKISLLGEKGPEPFIPDQPGTVLSNEEFSTILRKATQPARDTHIHLHGTLESTVKNTDLHQLVKLAEEESY